MKTFKWLARLCVTLLVLSATLFPAKSFAADDPNSEAMQAFREALTSDSDALDRIFRQDIFFASPFIMSELDIYGTVEGNEFRSTGDFSIWTYNDDGSETEKIIPYYMVQSGKAMTIYRDLHLVQKDCAVAMIMNAQSKLMGKKDIIKVECPIEELDLDIVGFIDHNITVNIIKNEQIVEKRELKPPKQIVNVIRCKNPRCITSIEQGLDQVFILSDEQTETYRCKYCEEKYGGHRNK